MLLKFKGHSAHLSSWNDRIVNIANSRSARMKGALLPAGVSFLMSGISLLKTNFVEVEILEGTPSFGCLDLSWAARHHYY